MRDLQIDVCSFHTMRSFHINLTSENSHVFIPTETSMFGSSTFCRHPSGRVPLTFSFGPLSFCISPLYLCIR